MSGKKRNRCLVHFIFLALIWMFMGSVSVQAATKYNVTFNNNKGTSKSESYLKLNTVAGKGTSIVLPSFKSAKGYVNLGWTTEKGKTSPLYQFGSKYKVSKETNFYLVRKPVYTVSFANSDGNVDEFLKGLSTTVQSGNSVVLPQAASKEAYTFMGWAKAENSAVVDYKAGDSFQPETNVTFYAVYSKTIQVTFLSNDGSKVYKKVSMGAGGQLKIPGRSHEEGYTFLGWSTKPGTADSPSYLVDKTVTIKKNLKLYAVQYKKSGEYNYKASALPKVNTSKYTKVILVGDSRTYRLKQTLENQFSEKTLKGVEFVAKGGATLNWFNETGYEKMMKAVGNGGTEKKPIAIVFNLGVNDLQSISDYIARMKKVESALKGKNCKLFYMSVNPVNNIILRKNGSRNRPESQIYSFNKKVQAQLCTTRSFTYIDSFTYLMKTGFSFDNGRGVDSGFEDGIHYSTKTYKRIYAYVIDTLNKM